VYFVSIEELEAFVDGIVDPILKPVAKRCIDRITSIEHFFTDSSGASTRQLFGTCLDGDS